MPGINRRINEDLFLFHPENFLVSVACGSHQVLLTRKRNFSPTDY